MPMNTTDRADSVVADAIFAGSGEMVERCRQFDWSSTPLGPVSSWSPSLRTTVSIAARVAQSDVPLVGTELVQLYNDAYARASAG